ncbi:MAG: hypothetical protein WA821_19370 [Anaerolineales bacterium]
MTATFSMPSDSRRAAIHPAARCTSALASGSVEIDGIATNAAMSFKNSV